MVIFIIFLFSLMVLVGFNTALSKVDEESSEEYFRIEFPKDYYSRKHDTLKLY